MKYCLKSRGDGAGDGELDIYINKSMENIYGWIAKLLYRLEKKMDEKKFSILEILSSAS